MAVGPSSLGSAGSAGPGSSVGPSARRPWDPRLAARGTLGTRAPPADGRRVHLRRPRRPSAGGNWPRNPLLPLLLFLFPFPPFPPFFFSLLFPSFLLSFALISLNFFALRVKYTAPRFFFALRAKNTAPNFFSPLRGVCDPRPCGTPVHRLRGLRGVRRAWDPRHLPRRNAGFFSSALRCPSLGLGH